MDNFGIVILWAALVQGLLLSLLYIFSKTHKSFANRLLGFFLLGIILEALTTVLPFRYVAGYPIDTYFSLFEVKLFIPLLFLHYVLEKLGKSDKYLSFLRYNYLFATAIASITILNIYFFMAHGATIESIFGVKRVEIFHLTQQLYAFILLMVAFVISIGETLQYRELARNEFSDFKMLQINWLWQFIFMLLPATILWGIEIIRIFFIGPSESNFEMIIWGFVALFLYFLSYKAFQHKNLFERFPESTLKPVAELPFVTQNTHCDEAQSTAILNFMNEREMFLDPDLTLHRFASAINMSPRSISACINTTFGNNFNEWVNGFRVNKALDVIEHDVKNHLSLEGIGTLSGFKSRSTMYSAFQRKLGHAPGHFRKS